MKQHIIVLALCAFFVLSADVSAQTVPGLHVQGRQLLTPCGDTLMLRGVNKMVIWTGDLELRKKTYAEIKKSGANCVRIVWLAKPTAAEMDAGPEGLDRNIQDAIDAGLIPMVELHDATGEWAKLSMVVDYWTRPDVVAVVKKHERYMISNIANECGDETVTDEQFVAGYTTAIQRMRTAGITPPFVIDGADWGKNLAQLVRTAPALTAVDDKHNILYSVHMYWAVSDGANAAYITQQLTSAVESGMPFIVGEFTRYFNREGACSYETAYLDILSVCAQHKIGWLAWEWGPGNEFADPTCDVMNMTTNSMYATLKEGWPRMLVETSPDGIKQTSRSPYFVLHNGACNPVSVNEERTSGPVVSISPNPATGMFTVSYVVHVQGPVQISIVDNVGSELYALLVENVSPGTYTTPISIDQSGVYFCRTLISAQSATMPIVVVK